jgi:hypothetical protein
VSFQEIRQLRFIRFPSLEKDKSVREQGIEDNACTHGEVNEEEWKKLHNEGLVYFYSSCCIIRAIKSECMCQQGHAARVDEIRNA